jgi:hypothetical protein
MVVPMELLKEWWLQNPAMTIPARVISFVRIWLRL